MGRKKENRTLQCYLCRMILKGNKLSNLRRHMRLHGPATKCFKCLVCKNTFQNKSNLKQHWQRKHQTLADNIIPKMKITTRNAKSKPSSSQIFQLGIV